MAPYGQLNAVADPATRQLLQLLFDQVTALRSQVTTLQAQALQRSGSDIVAGARITGLTDPVSATDAVNVQTLRRYVAGQLSAFAEPPT